MQLINPIWLWGLTGLLIPIAIHLLSRKEGKVIKFGSLRHLEESQSKQSINIRLNEIALLLLRCTLISLIVLVLCGLDTDLFRSGKNKWIVIEKGLNDDKDILRLTDSLEMNGFEVRSMSKGFPPTFDNPAEPFANYWEMVNQLPVGSLNEVIIVSYSYASKFKGKRIALPDNVKWVTKEPDAKDFILATTRFSDDSVLVRAGKSTLFLTEFTNRAGRPDELPQSDKIIRPDTIRIVVCSDPGFEYDRNIIIASLNAIENSIPVVFKTTDIDSSNDKKTGEADWTIWLSEKDPEIKNGNLISLEDNGISDSPLLQNVISKDGQRWLITKRLNEEIALKNQLTLNLSHLLANSDMLKLRADSLDQTMQPEEFLIVGNGNVSTASLRIEDESAEQLLLMIILVLLASERILSFKRNA